MLSKKYLVIGIDLSLNSTGVTFISDKSTKYLSILNKYVFTKSTKKTIGEVIENSKLLTNLKTVDNLFINFITREPTQPVTKVGLIPWQRKHISDAMLYSNIISQSIKSVINTHYNGYEPIICIEHYSLGSKDRGNQTIQIIEITSMLKSKLLTEICKLDNFYVASGPTIKSFAGKGDFDKYQMFVSYIANNKNTNDNFLIYTKTNKTDFCKPFKRKLKKQIKGMGMQQIIIDTYEILSPISDIIDSWWIAKHIVSML